MSFAAVQKHVAVLERASLVTKEKRGREQIVRAHLERALEPLTDAEQDLVATAFNHLVTPSGAKIAHGLPGKVFFF